jgi:hypothetical protein
MSLSPTSSPPPTPSIFPIEAPSMSHDIPHQGKMIFVYISVALAILSVIF